MPTFDPRIDAYIAKAADFAQPILTHLREIVHKACPDVEETWKWSFPCFNYSGAILCSMAGFKQHCTFGFWKATLLSDPYNLLEKTGESAMGHLGKITSLADLPSDEVLIQYIREAMVLNETGVKVPKAPAGGKKEIPVPAYFTEALQTNPQAQATFENFSPSCRREYLEWITEAKTEATREKRLATALEWMAEGKQRNWKYQKK